MKSLPWPILCLDAAHGWICAGGKPSGQCAFVKIPGPVHDDGTPPILSAAEVDDVLPLNLDPESRALATGTSGWLETPAYQPYEVHYYELGSAIVNSVKIHKIQSPQVGLSDDVVVISA